MILVHTPKTYSSGKNFFFAKFISNGKWAAAAIQMSQLLEAISGSLFAFQMKNMFPHISFIIPCDSLLCCCTSYTCSIILRCFSKKEAICEDFQLISLVNWYFFCGFIESAKKSFRSTVENTRDNDNDRGDNRW